MIAKGTPACIDLDRAIAPQVFWMDPATYHAWIDDKRSYLQPVRVFRLGLLEKATYTPWWVVPLVWFSVVAVQMREALLSDSPRAALVLLAGYVAWFPAEYVLHRYAFHFRPRSGVGNVMHFLLHGIHHLSPDDPLRLVFPPFFGLTCLYAPFLALLSRLLPWPDALSLASGLLLGYVQYDMTHYYLHFGRKGAPWLRRATSELFKRHMSHHSNTPHLYFGVSNTIVDALFGTNGATRKKSNAKR